VSAWMVIVVWATLRDKLPTTGNAVLAGSLTGGLLLVHVRNVGLVGALLALGLRRYWRTQPRVGSVASFLTTVLIFACVRTIVNHMFWGTWLMSPHARAEWTDGALTVAAETAVRLLGWLFDQEHGLLAYAPIYVLALPGVLLLWRESRERCAELMFLGAAYVGPMALPMLNPHGWRGGWSPAGRFLVPVVPLLAIPAFFLITRLGRLSLTMRVLVALQVFIDVVVWQWPKVLWNDGTGVSNLLVFLCGRSRVLVDWTPSVTLPWTWVTALGVTCASAGWLFWSVWTVRRIEGVSS
jgi:hypothetical protein